MRREDLREGTKKAAQVRQHKMVKRLSKGEKNAKPQHLPLRRLPRLPVAAAR